MKFISLIIIFCAVSLWGILKAEDLKRRVQFLSEAEKALLSFENAVSAASLPLPEALSCTESPLFCKAGKLLEEKGTKGFLDALEGFSIDSPERKVLQIFGEGLSAQDKEGQIKNALLCRKNIEALKEEAVKNVSRLSKLYAVGGVLCGAVVVIVFI